ncbi:MAG TPA: hypothetical protein PKL10_02415 [Nitrospira sp.]|nr:hypothetical protein [Nitrospira sp.]
MNAVKVYATVFAVLIGTGLWAMYRQVKVLVCRHTFYAFEPFGHEPIIRCLHCGKDGAT